MYFSKWSVILPVFLMRVKYILIQVHSNRYVLDDKKNVSSETHSANIQQDVITLLGSPDTKFANSIGIGSPCHVPPS